MTVPRGVVIIFEVPRLIVSYSANIGISISPSLIHSLSKSVI